MTIQNQESSVNVELIVLKNEECLKFTFIGHFTEELAEYGIREWEYFFASAEDRKVIIIWDSKQMTGFDNKARVLWQKAIKKFKKQIECVWLISDSKIIRAGAKAMSVFTSFCLKAVKNDNEIKFK